MMPYELIRVVVQKVSDDGKSVLLSVTRVPLGMGGEAIVERRWTKLGSGYEAANYLSSAFVGGDVKEGQIDKVILESMDDWKESNIDVD